MTLPWSLALSLLHLLLLSPPSTSSSATPPEPDAPTPYEIIEGFNFPRGILPKGALGYELDRGTGRFSAFLNGSCSFALEGSYRLRYESTIGGTISRNRLANLSGVSVKVLFLWLDIVEVSRRGGDLEFSVGIASAAFPVENFFECPRCGCGLDCGDAEIRNPIKDITSLFLILPDQNQRYHDFVDLEVFSSSI